MDNVNWSEVSSLLDQLYKSTEALESIFVGRKFTLDGHLVGSVGEVVAAYMFGLELNPASTKAHDAKSPDGRNVEIKFTQGRAIGIRHEPEHLLVLSRPKGECIQVVYNGSGSAAWNAAGKMQKNGQRPISLSKLSELSEEIHMVEQLVQIRSAPV